MKHSSIESAKKSLSLSSVLSDASLSLSSAYSKKKTKKNVFRVCKMVFFPL